MVKLGVNVDHVATLRQARGGVEPDPVAAAAICEVAGAHGITIHLRGDRRHIQDRDVSLLRQVVKTKLNMEMAATDEMVSIALDIKPDQVTLVPEQPKEVTTEGGLDVVSLRAEVTPTIEKLQEAGIVVSIFIEPNLDQIKAARMAGADFVELHTGLYAQARNEEEQDREFQRLLDAAQTCKKLDVGLNAGHDLNYSNIAQVAMLPRLHEVNIGHNIMARAVLVGLDRAVRDMLELLNKGNSNARAHL